MLDVHIDDFFKDCATILLTGFRSFPRPQTLFIEDISGPDDRDDFGLHSNRHLAALGALVWLQEEGYVRFTGLHRQESVDEFVLTSKSLGKLLAIARSENDPISAATAPTPLFQVLEFARLQGDSTWVRQLVCTYMLGQP
ncbi:hypothetical protein [Parathalassolituus penaei]|uniref:Uncharacterized protein n=1 Tax=Parathalassolituus penaei TaxID=2997323 RepID=A0A9X3EBQ9_9GAMM|nr:hypothetical protein [Parathalassolituus penaei]MCY0964634.1 hypothetical protein [Parathalassolituus penaei]